MNYIEKAIYNQYLITSRSVKNKPFRVRQNFDNFDESKAMICQKISRRLSRFPNINLKDFFYAPYHDDKDAHVQLDFYATSKALTAYTRYMRYIENLDPDEKESLVRTSQSFIFIRDYIKNQNITIDEYFNKKEDNQYICIMHLKNHNTWLYSLLSFDQFNRTLLNCDKDIVKLMCGEDFFDRVEFARTKFLVSVKTKNLIKQIKTKLKILNNNL